MRNDYLETESILPGRLTKNPESYFSLFGRGESINNDEERQRLIKGDNTHADKKQLFIDINQKNSRR